MKPYIFTLTFFLAGINSLFSQQVNWPETVSSADLIWAKVDSNFYNGAFIGDGIQGAMIMRDAQNPDGIRMLMGHYKAIAHSSISGWEYCDSRVYAGNIIIDPAGNTLSQNMRLNIFNGEAGGTIITDKGKLTWNALSDRKNLVFVVSVKGENGEVDANAGVREEWAITPRIYLENKNPGDYVASLPPKPVKSKQGQIDLVINKMKNRGAHVVASQLVTLHDNSKVLYVAIGVDDSANTTTAASKATTDAISRIQKVVNEGFETARIRNQNWWNNYMLSSKLAIKEDPYWQKFWWLQMYKFGCASSETSDFVIDTQGPWIWETAWAAVWWNLNVQLSYFPMFSGNKLDAGRSLINGVDRIYKSGALKQNAGGTGIDIGRSTTYEGFGNWGNEYGNLPWVLHCYWKYWQYSGDDEIGRKLFPMLKDNADFLITKLEKQADGKYHLKPSRSPEYTDNVLLNDANYSLMSLHWVMKTLLEMNSYFGFNDTKSTKWQEVIENLVAFPANENGFMVGDGQGFDMGHRHYSHLLAVYPYHTVTTDNGQTEIIKKSVNRWLNLTEASGNAGYTYTGGCAMLATLNDGNNALRLLDKLKTDKLQPNTMYSEGGGPVIETPLSGVESINYLLLQSWGGIIRVFPAVPSRWKNISFENLRTEGAFLISANLTNGVFDHFFVFSEKGKECKVKNPWKDKKLVVKDETGNSVSGILKDGIYVFPTQTGKKYRVEIAMPNEIN
jgi:alpha-L-fucosidase 2